MKKSAIFTLILTAVLLSGCNNGTDTVTDAADRTTADVTTTDESETAAQPEDTTDTYVSGSYLWENSDCYVDITDNGYTLYSKLSGEIIREYEEFGIMSAIQADGSVSGEVLAIGLSDDGKLVVYSLDAQNGEKVVMTVENSAHIMGDYLVADFILYTADLRPLGKTHALYPTDDAPLYNQTAQFGLPDSEYSIRFYLTEAFDGRPKLPSDGDTTEYIEFAEGTNGESIGVYSDNGKLMYRHFKADPGQITPLGVYVREETSVASIAGNIAGYDLYYISDANFLADKSGNVVMLEFGSIWERGSFVFAAPTDVQLPYKIYTEDLTPIIDGCMFSASTDDGRLIAWQRDTGGDITAEIYNRVVLIDKFGTVTTLTECDKVYALSDYGALYLKDGKLLHITAGGAITELSEWSEDLTYIGQSRIGEFKDAPDEFYFANEADTNENGVTLKYEWSYDPQSGEFDFRTYYAEGLHESVHKLGRSY